LLYEEVMTEHDQGRILLVDDDDDAREALSEILSINGFRVSCAENGKAALDEIREQLQPPRLILLDLAMPVMDGNTFLALVRQDDRTKDIPVIVTTGNPLAGPPSVTTILTKPIKPEMLLRLVRRFVH
jgi:CheY-like chemotaxis protein